MLKKCVPIEKMLSVSYIQIPRVLLNRRVTERRLHQAQLIVREGRALDHFIYRAVIGCKLDT